MTKHIAEGIQLSDGACIILDGGIVTGSATPTSNTDGATKGYADSIISKRIFFRYHAAAYDAVGYHKGRFIGSNIVYLIFRIPSDFASLVSAGVMMIPNTGTGGSGKDIDISSNYGTIGEVMDTHSESDTTTTYTLTVGQIDELDISGILTNIAADDIVGIKVVGNSLGGDVLLTGIRLVYN